MKRVAVIGESGFPKPAGSSILLFDTSDPRNPEIIDRLKIHSHCSNLLGYKGKMFCTMQGRLVVYDSSDLGHIEAISQLEIYGGPQAIVSPKDELLFLADWSNGVVIIDINKPKNPIQIGHIMNNEYGVIDGELQTYGVSGIALKEEMLLVVTMDYDMRQNREALYVYDLASVRNPKMVAKLDTSPCRGSGIAINRNYALMTGMKRELVIDISKLRDPSIISVIEDTQRFSMNPFLLNNLIYIPEIVYEPNKRLAGMRIVDFSNPVHVRTLSELLIPAGGATNVKVIENIAYLVCQGGFAIIDVARPDKPEILSLFRSEQGKVMESIEIISS